MSTVRRTDSPRPSTTPLFDRAPPFDPEAEIAVLGSIMLLPDVCDDVALILRGDDFHDDAHRKIYQHMLEMHESGRKIDPTLLVDKLKSAGDYESIGGAAYLGKILHAVPNAAHAIARVRASVNTSAVTSNARYPVACMSRIPSHSRSL